MTSSFPRMIFERERTLRLPAFAKINLCLHVMGRRPDGYHELRTIFQTISFARYAQAHGDLLQARRKR